MLDANLARLYEVGTKVLNQAVRRNRERFPADFLFQLTDEEMAALDIEILRSQSVTSSWGGRRYRPYVFTEQGVAMLSSVLKSERAIQVNIAIMRAFVKLRAAVVLQHDLARRLEEVIRVQGEHSEHIQTIWAAIQQLTAPAPGPGRRIGFPAG